MRTALHVFLKRLPEERGSSVWAPPYIGFAASVGVIAAFGGLEKAGYFQLVIAAVSAGLMAWLYVGVAAWGRRRGFLGGDDDHHELVVIVPATGMLCFLGYMLAPSLLVVWALLFAPLAAVIGFLWLRGGRVRIVDFSERGRARRGKRIT